MSSGPSEAFGGVAVHRTPAERLTVPDRVASRSLAARGLRGVKLVLVDDHKDLRAAARRVFNAPHQRCRVHWMRNALAHAQTKQRSAVAAMLKTIFAQEGTTDAGAQWDSVADALREKIESSSPSWTAPATMSSPTRAPPVLASNCPLDSSPLPAERRELPRKHWHQIASTSPLERVNREIKRRADVIGVRRGNLPLEGYLILLTSR